MSNIAVNALALEAAVIGPRNLETSPKSVQTSQAYRFHVGTASAAGHADIGAKA